MIPIQYVLLQVVVDAPLGERVTVGIVHSDGVVLRHAAGAARLPSHLRNRRELAVAAAAELRRFMGDTPSGSPALPGWFDLLVRTHALDRGMLAWTAPKHAVASTGEAHFRAVCARLGFSDEQKRPRSPQRVGLARLVGRVSAHAAQRFGENPRVAVDAVTSGLRPYAAPLSWQNGRWHRLFPWDLRALSETALIASYENKLGVLNAALPGGEVGVLLALGSQDRLESPVLSEAAHHALSALDGRVEVLRAATDGDTVDDKALLDRIAADVHAPDDSGARIANRG